MKTVRNGLAIPSKAASTFACKHSRPAKLGLGSRRGQILYGFQLNLVCVAGFAVDYAARDDHAVALLCKPRSLCGEQRMVEHHIR